MGDIRRLIQARLGVDVVLPEALARQVIEKAVGNPLFAEEIVSHLTEQGIFAPRSLLTRAPWRRPCLRAYKAC